MPNPGSSPRNSTRSGAPGTGHDRANLFACTLRDDGTDEQKRRLIPPSLRGESKWCLLYSEPGAGSDLAGLRTRADRDGDRFIVNGQKVWTSFAATADYGLLIARTDWDVPKAQGHQLLHAPDAPTRRRGPARFIRSPASRSSTRCSSPMRWCPPRTWWARRATAGGVLQTALGYERRLMGDLARTTRTARKPQDEEDVLIALAREFGKLDDAHTRQQIARIHELAAVNKWNTQRAKSSDGSRRRP